MAINTPAPTALGAIQTAAKARGLAWQPLAAVAHFESGLNPQSIGDGGHAFGLFQNNNAGGTITGDPNPRRFLNPNVSANYTADAIKRLGIQGMTPQAQVAAIVNRYERPANPGREIAGAQSYLATLGQQSGAGVAAPTPTSRQLGTSASTPVEGTPSLPTLSLAPLQQSLSLGQAQSQRAQDALAKLSGHSVQAQAAPDLSTLMAQQPAASKPAGTTVNLKSATTPKGLDAAGQKAVALARHYIGTPYVFGGASPQSGFDCSGFTQWVHAQLGVKIPRTAAEQFKAGKPVAEKDLQPGDSLFFSENGTIGHTGMYVGSGQFIEAPHTGDSIKIVPLAGHYQQILAGARRYA